MHKRFFYLVLAFCFAAVGCEKAEFVNPTQDGNIQFAQEGKTQNDGNFKVEQQEPCTSCSSNSVPFVLSYTPNNLTELNIDANCNYQYAGLYDGIDQATWQLSKDGNVVTSYNGLSWQLPANDMIQEDDYTLKVTVVFSTVSGTTNPRVTNKTLTYNITLGLGGNNGDQVAILPTGNSGYISCQMETGGGAYLVMAP